MPTVTWMTNIPTPYRNHRFQLLAEALVLRGWSLHVAYMAWTEPRREWRFVPSQLGHPHRVHRAWSPVIGEFAAHVAPTAWWQHGRQSDDVLVIGGVAIPTMIATAMTARPRSLVLASESNVDSEARTTGPAALVKRALVARADAFIVPGARALAYLGQYGVVDDRPVQHLPNIVAGTDERARPGRDGSRRLACVARISSEKNLKLLARAASRAGVDVDLIGDGPERDALSELAAVPGARLRVLGTKPASLVRAWLAGYDGFVLPSLGDPSPLSAVEAASVGLPLLLSSHVGNEPELRAAGHVNGATFDPTDEDAMEAALVAFRDASDQTLASWGAESLAIHADRFDPHSQVEQLATFLTEL